MLSNPANNSFSNNTSSNNFPQYPYHYPVQDPVRYWPSGTLTVPSAFAAAYIMTPGSHRKKLIAATLGVTIPLSLYNQAIENSNGFNMLEHFMNTDEQNNG